MNLALNFLMGSQAPPPAGVMLLPIFVLLVDVPLIFYCLNDLAQRVIVAGGDKRLWAAVIILGGPVGQIIYWWYGRGEY